MSAIDQQRAIADMIRTESKIVESYLDYAKRYADLSLQHAQDLCAEIFPSATTYGQRVIGVLPLDKNAPEVLRKKLEALEASKAKVNQVIVCPHTLTVYLFGPNDQ
jgi:hypothetical protein